MRERLLKSSYIPVCEAKAPELLDSVEVCDTIPSLDQKLMFTKNNLSVLHGDDVPKEPFILIDQLNRNKELDEHALCMSQKHRSHVYRLAFDVSMSCKVYRQYFLLPRTAFGNIEVYG